MVVDALSQKYEDDGSLLSLYFIVPYWLQVVPQERLQDPKILHLIQQLQANSPVSQGTLGTIKSFATKVGCI